MDIIDYLIFIISVIMILMFIYRQFHLRVPLLNLRVLRSFNHDLAVAFVALIVVTIIFPMYYQKVLHVSKLTSGLALIPGAVLLSLLNPYTGRLTEKIGFKKTVLIGMFMILIGWGALSITSNLNLILMIILAAIIESGSAFIMMPSVTMGANSLPQSLVSHGTALITTLRQIIGSTGVMVAMPILTNVFINNKSLGSLQSLTIGFKVTFIFFFIFEMVGIVAAFMIKNPTRSNS